MDSTSGQWNHTYFAGVPVLSIVVVQYTEVVVFGEDEVSTEGQNVGDEANTEVEYVEDEVNTGNEMHAAVWANTGAVVCAGGGVRTGVGVHVVAERQTGPG